MSHPPPKFVPILTSLAVRVSGRETAALLASGAGLARALLDSQKVVGHDGLLCLFHAPVLVESCVEPGIGPLRLRAPDDVAGAGGMAVMLDAVRALRRQVAPGTSVFAAFAGPGLLLAELAARANSADAVDEDYAGDVFLAAVRAAFEAEAHGIAVIEQRMATVPPGLASLYRSANKLAEFYDGLQMVFHLPGPTLAAVTAAHHSFLLDDSGDPCRPNPCVSAAAGGRAAPVTTPWDVPAETPVRRLRELRDTAFGNGR